MSSPISNRTSPQRPSATNEAAKPAETKATESKATAAKPENTATVASDGFKTNTTAVALPASIAGTPKRATRSATNVPFSAKSPLTTKNSTSSKVDVNSDGVTASGNATVSGQANLPKGASISFEASVSASASAKRESKDGFTTSTLEGQVKMKVGGSADVGVVGAGASVEQGSSTKYQVRVPDAAQAQIDAGKAPQPSPYDPSTMPAGSSVLLESKDFKGTHFEASYRQIKLDNDIKEEKGSSMLVEKLDNNKVRVTTGPSEALQNSFQVGVKLGPAEVSIGNTTKLDSSKLKTAEFDLSTAEGKAAYNEFMSTGKMPTQNTNGVSNAATIEKISISSTAELKAQLGPIGGSITNTNAADRTVTTFPDGSKKAETNVNYGSAVPLQIQQTYGPDGKEDVSKQKFTLDLGKADPGTAQSLVMAFTGDQAKSEQAYNDAKSGKSLNFKLELTSEQAGQLQQRVKDYYAAIPGWHPISVQDHTMNNFANAKDPLAAMMEIGRGWSNNASLAEDLMVISLGQGSGLDTFQKLPGSLQQS